MSHQFGRLTLVNETSTPTETTVNYLTATNTNAHRVATMTLAEIIDLDVAALRAAHRAAKIHDFEFRILPADDEALRYHLFRHRCSDVRSTPQSEAAYFTPRLIQTPMREGLSFADALASIEPPHQHDYVTTTEGGFDPIMGTGRQTVTSTCSTCGHTTTQTTVRNWSGD
jgi:hypothetical protein